MNSKKRIRAILTLKENGNTVKTIKFYLGIKINQPITSSTTFRQKFGKNSYTLTLIAGEEVYSSEEESEQSLPWAIISLPGEINVSSQNLPNFLSSIVSEDKFKKHIQENVKSFSREIRLSF